MLSMHVYSMQLAQSAQDTKYVEHEDAVLRLCMLISIKMLSIASSRQDAIKACVEQVRAGGYMLCYVSPACSQA